MIIDYSGVIDLAVGVDRRTLQDGDAQLTIPPTVVPIVHNIRITNMSADSTTVHQASALAEVVDSMGPSTTNRTTNVLLLQRGLWEIDCSLATKFDYNQALGTNSPTNIQIVYQSYTVRLLSRYPAIGNFSDGRTYRLLLIQTATIRLFLPTTLAAQNQDAHVSVNAVRVL